MDNSSSSASQSQPAYKPGTVKSIKLINFMCHESFELTFGSRVNFIIGPNGSGKSALLTALVVALGGRASTTSRAKKISDFIMNGKNQAKICVVIHNYEKIMDKDGAFKPDDYGKSITIEKIISRDDATRLALKNDKDKKVSERKQELDEMVDHFGILINNPICILNQEVSKTFLHSKKPEDKFDLFLKATNLEQIEQDYKAAQSSHKEWGDSNSRKSVAFRLLDAEYNACKEKVGFIENRAKLNDTREDLNGEYIWAITRDNEELSKSIDEKVQKISKEIDVTQKTIDRRSEKIKNHEEDIEVMKSKLRAINEQFEETRKKLRDIRSKELQAKKKEVDSKERINVYEKRISEYFDDKSSLEKSILELKKQFRDQNALDQDNEQRKLDIERLERELKNDSAKEKTIRLSTEQLSTSMTSTRSDLTTANMRLNELKTKILQNRGLLNRLKNGQENAIRKYGDFVVSIRQEIDSAFVQGKFRKKPIGPLGYHLKLKSQDIAPSLDLCLGRNAHAFTCDNHQDMSTLTQIFKKLSSTHSRDFRQPMIITRPFRQRHDTSRHKAQHNTYRTFLDYLDIEDDAVHNVLVDRCSLDAVLFIPDYNDAQRTMIQKPELIPRNTIRAYTKDCCVMYPNTENSGYKSFANDPSRFCLFAENNIGQIKSVELDIGRNEIEIRDAERVAASIQDSLNAQRVEYNSNNDETKRLIAEMRQKEKDLIELKTTISKEPQELSALEADLEVVTHQIGIENVTLDDLRKKHKDIEKEIADIIREGDSCGELQRSYERDRESILKMIDETKNSITQAKIDVGKNKIIIDNRKKDRAQEIVKLDEALEKLARSCQNISSKWPRPKDIRTTDIVKEELRKIDAQLRAEEEEMRDPQELIASLNKRMEEIKELVGFKESNLNNFDSSSKTLKEREEGFLILRDSTIGSVSTTFSAIMRSMKMNGELQIHLDDVHFRGEIVKKARTLEMQIDTNYTPTQRANLVMNDNNNNTGGHSSRRLSHSQPNVASIAPPRAKRARKEVNRENDPVNEKENGAKMTDARSLSGGERSFSTVAFVLALWHHCSSPFKLMDEIDVFMDMVTRRVSYNALIRFAQCTEDPGQFIFFSPLELPKIDDSGTSVRVFEMPCIVRKRPHSQMQANT